MKLLDRVKKVWYSPRLWDIVANLIVLLFVLAIVVLMVLTVTGRVAVCDKLDLPWYTCVFGW